MKRKTRLFPILAVASAFLLGWAAPAALQEGALEPAPAAEVPAADPVGADTAPATGEALAPEGAVTPEESSPEGVAAEEGAPEEGVAEEERSDDGGASEGVTALAEGEQPSDEAVPEGEEQGEAEAGEALPDPLANVPVRAIVVRGNRHVDVAVILDAIKATKVGEPLELDAIRSDLRSIDELGYFADVRADTVLVEGGLRVIFQVVENPVVTEIRVESERVDAQELRRLIRQREGEVLNSVQLEEDLERIHRKVRDDYGYDLRLARAEITPEGVLDLGFRLTKVKEVLVRGNRKTKEFVIRREITVKPGEPLRWDDITRSLDRLQRLGYFQDVRPIGEDTEDPDWVNVVFEVEERLTGTALIGAGYSSEDGLLGYAEISDRNFLGRGQQVSVRAEFGQRRTLYDLAFYEPYLFGSRNSFGINLYSRSFERYPTSGPAYVERRTGGDFLLGRALSDTTRVSVRYRADNLRTEALEEGDFEETRGRTRSVTLAAAADTTDHWLSPVRGFRGRISTELGGGWLGGDFTFTKYEAEYSRYFKVGSQRQTIAVRAMGGLGVGEIMEAEEQFRIGGADTVRGYAANSMEGDRMLVFNAEYRFPLSDSVQGVIFADAGEAWNSKEGSKGMKVGYGIGARLDTPLGVLRLDYGLGSEGGRLHFFFGPSF